VELEELVEVEFGGVDDLGLGDINVLEWIDGPCCLPNLAADRLGD
jgi:hypothetical protein